MAVKSIFCERCNVVFTAYSKASRPRRFCSPACGMRSREGIKQSSDHIAARSRFGADHPNWKGDSATVKTGRTRALRAHALPYVCDACANPKRLDRHHKDGNTLNNEKSNIAFLCRACHTTAHGGSAKMKEVRRGNSLSR